MVTTRGYTVHVNESSKKELAICLVFISGLSGPHRMAEFRLATSTFDDTGLSITSHRQANFRERLRLLNVTHEAFAGNESDDGTFIEGKMREAFGPGTVEITFIEPAPKIGH